MSRFRFTHPFGALEREFHISRDARTRYDVDETIFSLRGTAMLADHGVAQRLATAMNAVRDVRRFPQSAVRAGDLFAAGLLDEILHLVFEVYREQVDPGVLDRVDARLRETLGDDEAMAVLEAFAERFPTVAVARGEVTPGAWLSGSSEGLANRQIALEELLMLDLANRNPAMERFGDLFDANPLTARTRYPDAVETLRAELRGRPGLDTEGGAEGAGSESLLDLLEAPVRASPTSLEGQLGYVRARWGPLLGSRFQTFLDRILLSLDLIEEERRPRAFGGPGPSIVPDSSALRGRGREEYEAFSADENWMPRLVMLAKSTYVWLDQLSKRYQRDIRRLDQIPDEVLDELADRGFSGLWLIGLWERSEASRRIKHLRGQQDAVASAYALYDYQIAEDLGGDAAYTSLRDRAWHRGIRLASDMVPNHVGIDGKWVMEHPDWFVQVDHAPYPGYSFAGPDLSSDGRAAVFLEDHYYDSSDASVVFKRVDRDTGRERFIYHGNDGTSMPWNDTAQLDYLNSEVREAVIQTILHVARKFPIIRFDAAMTLAKQHIQRLWYPEPGHGGAIPSRSQYGSMPHEEFERRIPQEFWREVVDRVAEEVPGTLLLAEAFWMMEGYFVRTLGMHRVYNSAFMNMFKREENDKYRQLIKNTLEFDPEILKRYVNFMNNPDEETAVAQFGRDDKYFGTTVVMSTMPGLPMYGHGQVEGYTEKYGMEYRRAKLDERPDEALVERHRREVFPLLHRREQFAHVDHFRLYDVRNEHGVDEDVYAYSNRHRGRASLVLYNNRFGRATGWIRESSPFVVKDGDAKDLRTEGLATALGVQGGPDRYLILRDHIASDERLRASDEVRDQGLYVELEAFKYQVYVDIREVVDVDGTYGELHRRLKGAPVPSVDDARRDLVLVGVHEAFRSLLDLTVRVSAAGGSAVNGAEASATPERSDAAAGEFGRDASLGSETGRSATGRGVTDTGATDTGATDTGVTGSGGSGSGATESGATDGSTRGAGASSLGASTRGESIHGASSRGEGDAYAGAYDSFVSAAREHATLELRPAAAARFAAGALRAAAGLQQRWMPDSAAPHPLLLAAVAVVEPLADPAATAEELRLDRALLARLEEVGLSPTEAWLQSRLFLAIASALPHVDVAPLRVGVILEAFGGTEAGRSALGVNRHEGTAWFHRERYRAAMEALLAVAAWLRPDDRASVERLAAQLQRAEETSGYRLDALVGPASEDDDAALEGERLGEAAPLEAGDAG